VWHVSHIHELIKYSDALINHSGPVEQILRRTVPFGYDLVASTWNDNAPPALRRRFATVPVTHAGEEPVITITGIPITMNDLNITPDDCGLGHLSNQGSDVQALTHHIAMGVVHSRQRRDDEQHRRNAARLSGFGSSSPRYSRKRPRMSEDAYYGDAVSATRATPSFSQENQPYNPQYIVLDDDSLMTAPEPSHTLLGTPISSADDTLLADAIQELPNFGDDVQPITEPDPIDFGLLGVEDV